MTNQEWAKAQAEAERVYKISQGPLDNMEYFDLVQTFYEKYSLLEIERLKKQKDLLFNELKNDIEHMRNQSSGAVSEEQKKLDDAK